MRVQEQAVGWLRDRWPFRPERWRSPLRGPWLTAVFGLVLLVALPIVAITGLLSYIAYGPQFGQAIPGDVGWLRLPGFDWPTHPAWLYQLTQGLHVGLGLVLVPVVLAKLWSVLPRLFAWPPVRSVTHLLERLSVLLLVGSILFEIVTGLLNIQYDYVFGFSFYTAHYYGAWVFMAALAAHLVIKFPALVAALRSRSLRVELRTSRADTRQEPQDGGLVATAPTKPTISRRGALGVVAGGSLLVGVLSVGQTVGWLRPLALLVPRGLDPGDGPNGFPVNRTAAAAGITATDTGPAWTLQLTGTTRVALDRAGLAALPQHTATLPIACVEGWSTTQEWTGVRLRDLARLSGVDEPTAARVRSCERDGAFNSAMLQGNQVLDPDALLALLVNGADLSPDHGYPARVIVPALPGVHNTKWVRSIEFLT
ncbi:molybdopterin-dependent oxidoreductase [Actinokineospora cianjurensis]|uniref:molybdopterin-dependent oxidoreductase n=1 Tax=Actinokineospora cianjurensis TaxID=585224 RepID=UPI000EB17706|nr:molybdopterin-dependent oxidoreductase [Actinokineospora cianjurensis]